jgi:hypothetical protein
MRVPPLASLLEFLDISTAGSSGGRTLQELPDYTSPPALEAIDATPVAFQEDAAVDAARSADADGRCATLDPAACQLLFPPPAAAVDSGTAKLGVIFYVGALVDPRSYSPMMKILAEMHGIAAVVPIFADDLAFKFGRCESGRLNLAKQAFPEVEKWVFAGHSFGGLTAHNDIWSMMERNDTDAIAGLALLASYVRQDLGCGAVDFSAEQSLPATSISTSLDGVINVTNFDKGQALLPADDGTFSLMIPGGNHGQFGSYDDSGRKTILGQNDGIATIPASVQQDMVIGAILHVASRSGLPLPSWVENEEGCPSSTSNVFAVAATMHYVLAFATMVVLTIF